MKIGFRSNSGATLLDVREAMIHLKRSLTGANYDHLDISSAEIVIAEVLNNVVKHAQEEQTDGWFDLKCEITNSGLQVACRDNGKEMPGGVPPVGALPTFGSQIAELPEGGWGWSLVRTLASNLRYVRFEGLNMVSFTIAKTSGD